MKMAKMGLSIWPFGGTGNSRSFKCENFQAHICKNTNNKVDIVYTYLH